MSEITRAVIQMPYDMAMDGEISRQQFYNRAQTLLADFETLAQRLQEAERLLQIAYDHGRYRRLSDQELGQIDAFLAGKGVKP